ncbi:TPA: putative toxin-antitoxin system toxin component, PIN family [Candidatus Delongbacteria bacterium]|nr:putative toxin-antitoxin system toxin component, PIN family [Candidatus Delongbacteria bacterium]
MKIVLDTNVLISGLINPNGIPGFIVRLVASGYIELVYDYRIISEYREVMSRPKFHIDEEKISDLIEQIKAHGELVSPLPLSISIPDAEDLKFLETAVSSGTEYLITGNLKHFPAPEFKGVKIISPSHFFEKTLK